jgi:hypothetical protein
MRVLHCALVGQPDLDRVESWGNVVTGRIQNFEIMT